MKHRELLYILNQVRDHEMSVDVAESNILNILYKDRINDQTD